MNLIDVGHEMNALLERRGTLCTSIRPFPFVDKLLISTKPVRKASACVQMLQGRGGKPLRLLFTCLLGFPLNEYSSPHSLHVKGAGGFGGDDNVDLDGFLGQATVEVGGFGGQHNVDEYGTSLSKLLRSIFEQPSTLPLSGLAIFDVSIVK